MKFLDYKNIVALVWILQIWWNLIKVQLQFKILK